jgi:hypothetical protein
MGGGQFPTTTKTSSSLKNRIPCSRHCVNQKIKFFQYQEWSECLRVLCEVLLRKRSRLLRGSNGGWLIAVILPTAARST